MVIFIDIDGTVCPEGDLSQRLLQEPFPGAVETVNGYIAAGHTVVFWTARGWHEYLQTKKWLDENGFKYSQLIMGKPITNLFIDDRARQFVGWDQNYLGAERESRSD